MADTPLTVRLVGGAEIFGVIENLAQLRTTVFRDFPYLYDGDPANEAAYLRSYGDDPQAVLVAAWDGGRMVGAATAMPLSAHGDATQMTLPDEAPAASDIYYLAESVLLPAYRGQGLGHAFFDHREAVARAAGFTHCAFAAVIRPTDHPARPADYQPLKGFWHKRGYAPLAGGQAHFTWCDVGEPEPTTKALQVWLRQI